MKLRDATSYFLLAYFFPGCDKEDAEPQEVRSPANPSFRPGIVNMGGIKMVPTEG